MVTRNVLVQVSGGLQEAPSGDTAQAPALGASGVNGLSPGRFVGVTVLGAPSTGTFIAGDYVFDQSGNIYVCTISGAQGTWVTPNDSRDRLAVGEEIFDSSYLNAATLSYANQLLRLTYFTSRKSETTTQVRVISGGTAAGATPSLVRIGLYLIDPSTQNGTLVAATSSDTSVFATANTAYTRSWASPYAKIAGLRYALGILIVTAAATPTFTGQSYVTGNPASAEFALYPRKHAQLGSQSDLPSTFTNASLTASNGSGGRHYGVILP
jgi:hypothetical protein